MRTIWEEHKTSITLFVGATISLFYGIVQTHIVLSRGWQTHISVEYIIEQTSLFIPVAAVIVTVLAGGIDMSLWFSDTERKRIKKEKKRRKREAIRVKKRLEENIGMSLNIKSDPNVLSNTKDITSKT